MKPTDSLVEVRPHVYVSKHDPGYYRKVVHYHPLSADAHYEYALYLFKEGQVNSGFRHMKMASSLHHRQATHWVNQQRTSSLPPTPPKKFPWLLTCLLLLALLAFLVAAGLLALSTIQWFDSRHTVSHVTSESVFERHASTELEAISPHPRPMGTPTEADVLPVLMVQNAAERYEQMHGAYPSTDQLIGDFPNNHLSFLPSGTAYTLSDQGYDLSSSPAVLPRSLTQSDLLELHYYPTPNVVTLERGGEVLVTYPVASGPKPPPTSTVLTRVVEPLGSNGAYGSKALALEDGYAIHGTNDPSSIGSYETGGCLRMHDADIDNLFSYVAIGTPFISEPEGLTPPYATFGKSLPTLAESDQQSKQEKSELSFSWKH